METSEAVSSESVRHITDEEYRRIAEACFIPLADEQANVKDKRAALARRRQKISSAQSSCYFGGGHADRHNPQDKGAAIAELVDLEREYNLFETQVYLFSLKYEDWLHDFIASGLITWDEYACIISRHTRGLKGDAALKDAGMIRKTFQRKLKSGLVKLGKHLQKTGEKPPEKFFA